MLDEERETEREEAAEQDVGETLPVPGEQVNKGFKFQIFHNLRIRTSCNFSSWVNFVFSRELFRRILVMLVMLRIRYDFLSRIRF